MSGVALADTWLARFMALTSAGRPARVLPGCAGGAWLDDADEARARLLEIPGAQLITFPHLRPDPALRYMMSVLHPEAPEPPVIVRGPFPPPPPPPGFRYPSGGLLYLSPLCDNIEVTPHD